MIDNNVCVMLNGEPINNFGLWGGNNSYDIASETLTIVPLMRQSFNNCILFIDNQNIA